MNATVRSIVAGMAAALLCAAAAGAETAVNVNIRAQPMSDALNELAAQTGLQLLLHVERAMPAELAAPAVSGALTPSAALDKLLANSGLHYTFINERTVEIRAADTVKKTSRDAAPSAGRIHLTQGAQMQRVSGEKSQDGRETAAGDTAGEKGVPEILVKGARSINTDIKRTEDDPQPYVVFTGEEVLNSQAGSLGEFLKTRLPMNTLMRSSSQGSGASGTFSMVDLRGLGTNETLILIDGRRAPNVSSSGEFLQPDLNGVPLAAIERVEVLPSTAGGIYGGGATGGVINVILKHDYEGADAALTYSNTFDSDAGTKRFDLSAGFNLEGGRTRILVAASYSEGNSLLVGDRDFYQRARALLLHNNPNAIYEISEPIYGGTVNILSSGDTLTLDPQYGSIDLGHAITHLPLGYRGADSDGGQALIDNAGSYNLDLPNDLNGRKAGLLSTPAMRSASLNVRREFSRKLEAFVDLSTLANKGIGQGGGAANIVYGLPGSAPNNPFVEDITVSFPTPNLLFDGKSLTETVHATAGLIAHLPHRWVGELDLSWARSRIKYEGSFSFFDAAAAESLNTGEAPGDGRPALNVLQEGNTYPLDFSPYAIPQPNYFVGPSDTVLRDGTFRLSGPMFQLPAGPAILSALLERREEQAQPAFNTTIDPASITALDVYYPQRSQNADSIYLEARAPLAGRGHSLPGVRELELQTSIRGDRYKTRADNSFGYVLSPGDPLPEVVYTTGKFSSTDYTLGVRYLPVEDVAIRASYGTGFLPPSITQVASRQTVRNAPLFVFDPKRDGNDVYTGSPITLISGGSPRVNPENSKSWSAGIVFTPRLAAGLRLSVDYTKIDKVGEITGVSRQFIVDHEADFPGRIRRGPKLDTDDADWAGPITYIDSTLVNISTTQVEAWDTQADYDLSTARAGTFHFSLLATRQVHFKTQLLPESPVIDSVGHVNEPGGALAWRGNGGVSWTKGPLTVGWNAQYYDSYFITYVDPGISFLNPQIVFEQGSDTIASQLYHDLLATYRFDGRSRFAGGLLADTQLSLGIQNVFNKSPPILAELSPYEAYSTFGDPRLRRYTVSIRKRF